MVRNLLLPAIVTMAISTGTVHAAEIEGNWETTQGPVTISRSDDGTYVVSFDLIKGKVAGALSGDVFEGTWVRGNHGLRCPTEMEGSPFWGQFKITFYGPPGFTGLWSYCGDNMQGDTWAGARPK